MISITRAANSNQGTFGMLSINGVPQCLTLEPVIPVIPDGTYDCIPHSGPKFQNVWEVTKVPGHSAVLIHYGNTALADSTGCILVGTSFGNFEGVRGLQNSRLALDSLRQILPKTFNLTIISS